MKYGEMMRITVVAVMLTAMMMVSGCASYLSYESSKEEIQKERVYASGNTKAIRSVESGVSAETAIRAVALDNGGVGIGIDVSNLQALKQHPLRQLGAAVIDAGTLYGAYAGARSLNDSSSHQSSITSGRDTVNVNGNGNTVNNGNSKTETSTP